MASFCKNVQLFFFSLFIRCETPDDPAMAPVEAGHWEGGRGGEQTAVKFTIWHTLEYIYKAERKTSSSTFYIWERTNSLFTMWVAATFRSVRNELLLCVHCLYLISSPWSHLTLTCNQLHQERALWFDCGPVEPFLLKCDPVWETSQSSSWNVLHREGQNKLHQRPALISYLCLWHFVPRYSEMPHICSSLSDRSHISCHKCAFTIHYTCLNSQRVPFLIMNTFKNCNSIMHSLWISISFLFPHIAHVLDIPALSTRGEVLLFSV